MACNKFSPFTCYYMLVNFFLYLNPLPLPAKERSQSHVTIFLHWKSRYSRVLLFLFFFWITHVLESLKKTLFTLFFYFLFFLFYYFLSCCSFLRFFILFCSPNDTTKLNVFLYSCYYARKSKVTWSDCESWERQLKEEIIWFPRSHDSMASEKKITHAVIRCDLVMAIENG